MSAQTPVPAMLMRGGSSKGLFFAQSDLPADENLRNRVLLAAVGSPDPRQIDGAGGAHPLSSKVGIVSVSEREGVDLEFLFAQLQPQNDIVDTKPNCGNMLAAAVPFALEKGMVRARGEETTLRVLTLNTGMLSDITVQTPGGVVCYEGSAKIDGVPGTSAPVLIRFLDTEGSVAGSLLPTGSISDVFDIEGFGKLEATCIDNGMPMVLVRAADLDCTAYEGVADLNSNETLKATLEKLRLIAAEKMGLGDVSAKNYPKMCLLNAPLHGGAVHTRCFIPHVCHEAIGVLAAVTIATACVMENSVADGLAAVGNPASLSIEHPGGEFSVALETDAGGRVTGAALIRTARNIMRGEIMIPSRIWNGKPSDDTK
ncbi:4-oxalomesaconate tautomerase [Neisseria animalis]|uniref:4-oxalomesaconate tautomerase n=1 Tax=Neisseria animalis TaxID=492 RepID=A0A5P3MSQ0_NEIAN|nr:4-oxalomesaconate tautomerase [Neisseria animalis]QEY24632.1 4-oxalomesaconate tautomerase [Neisseria animalis]ROW33121.1 4-oxalomesaconate tautomerase [Neisseria animalis]VEE07520.1 putative AcnD-accessory protein PrpF [Neisseria animalis]